MHISCAQLSLQWLLKHQLDNQYRRRLRHTLQCQILQQHEEVQEDMIDNLEYEEHKCPILHRYLQCLPPKVSASLKNQQTGMTISTDYELNL